MRRTLVSLGFLVVAVSLVGCAGRDLRTLCSVAEEIISDHAEADPQSQARLFGQLAHERLSMFGSIREEIMKAAVLPPGKRYRYIRQAAVDAGHPEFDCPALRTVLEPDEVFDEMVPE